MKRAGFLNGIAVCLFSLMLLPTLQAQLADTPWSIFQHVVRHAGPTLYSNGSIITHPGGGSGGAYASAVQTQLGMGTYGFGHQFSDGNRVADDFTISNPSGWHIDTITFLAYQTSSGTTSTVTGVYLQIWNGRPGDPGSSVIFGDLTTNRMTGTVWSNIYRVLDTDLANTQRPVMSNTATLDIDLPAGTYWLEWMTAGGPWAPPITILGQTTTGNARQYISSGWNDLIDSGTNTQGLPFEINGTVILGIYPGPLTAGLNFLFDIRLNKPITQAFDYYIIASTQFGTYTLYFDGTVKAGIQPLFRNVPPCSAPYEQRVICKVALPLTMGGQQVTFYTVAVEAGKIPPVRDLEELRPDSLHVIMMDKKMVTVGP